MMTMTLSIDAGIAPVGVAPEAVPMTATLADNMQNAAAFQDAVAKFQTAMAAPVAMPEAVRTVAVSATGADPVVTVQPSTVPVTTPVGEDADGTVLATPETLKAVVVENQEIAKPLVEAVQPQKSPKAASAEPLQAAPIDFPVASAAVRQVVADAKVATVDAATARTQVLVDAVEAVCDTILVSPGLLRGQGEIRIQLKPEVLSGTEIHIEARGATLTVAFHPTTQDAATVLQQNIAQFEQHLAGRIHNYQIAARVNVDEKKLRS